MLIMIFLISNKKKIEHLVFHVNKNNITKNYHNMCGLLKSLTEVQLTSNMLNTKTRGQRTS